MAQTVTLFCTVDSNARCEAPELKRKKCAAERDYLLAMYSKTATVDSADQ